MEARGLAELFGSGQPPGPCVPASGLASKSAWRRCPRSPTTSGTAGRKSSLTAQGAQAGVIVISRGSLPPSEYPGFQSRPGRTLHGDNVAFARLLFILNSALVANGMLTALLPSFSSQIPPSKEPATMRSGRKNGKRLFPPHWLPGTVALRQGRAQRCPGTARVSAEGPPPRACAVPPDAWV